MENDHRISCVSLQLSSEQKPLFILIELYFMKRHIWRVSYFSSEHKPLFIPIGLCFMKRHVWSVSYFSSEHKPLFISIGLCFMKRHIRKVSYFSSEYKPLFMKRHVCFMKRHVWRVSYFFIKQLTKIETSSTFLNNHQKILQKIPELEFSFYETIFSKLKHHYYNISFYIPIYTTATTPWAMTHRQLQLQEFFFRVIIKKLKLNKI